MNIILRPYFSLYVRFIYIYFTKKSSDVNDAKLRLLVIDAELKLSFSEKKKTSPSRAETLAK